MADFFHSMGARLRNWFGNRRHPVRRTVRVPISVTVCDERELKVDHVPQALLQGNTIDISASGLAFTVPAIRIGHRYIAGEDRTLRIILELPTGSIEAYAIATRYERLEEDRPDTGYVVGARITSMSEDDRERLSNYLLKS
jgi:hypothetical protein